MTNIPATAVINVTPIERDAILRMDFLSFAQAAFAELYPKAKFEPNWHHQAIAELLLQSKGIKTRKYINAPPRSLKSFLVSVAWVAFRLGQEPTHKFICASYSRDLANHLANDCRRLMESKLYWRLFPTRLVKATEDELKTVEGGFRIATSVGATLTGYGADTIIVDDPMSANDSYSELARKNVNEWFVTTLMSRLDNVSGTIVMVAQRLHQDDLTGHLIRTGWEGLVLPAIAPCDVKMQIGNLSYLWKQGEPLQKTRWSLVALEDAKKNPETFASQYMQDPIPETGNMLNPAWIKRCENPPVPQAGDEIYMSCDTAQKATATSNFSVWLVLLVRNATFFPIEIWRRRVEHYELCAASHQLFQKYSPNAILIEDHALGSPLISQLKHDGVRGIEAIRPTADKKSRMKGVSALLESGALVLPTSLPGATEFLQEFRTFPLGEFDDQMDALSQVLAWWINREPPTKFSADFGPPGGFPGGGPLAAPSVDEMLHYLGR